jgi:hypothetical protein
VQLLPIDTPNEAMQLIASKPAVTASSRQLIFWFIDAADQLL